MIDMKLTKHPARPKGREAIKAWNRQKIIDATITSINRYGISGTTVARVVKLADVSMGLVNRHFSSKADLFHVVLEVMAEDYRHHWQSALAAAPRRVSEQLRSILVADLSPEILNERTMGVWFAFRAQARAQPEYVKLVGNRDQQVTERIVDLLQQLNEQSGQDHPADLIAQGLISMLEGIWTDYFLHPKDYRRDLAVKILSEFLNALYPGYFDITKGPVIS